MQRQRLTLEGLKLLDRGVLAEVFEDEVRHVVRDCDQRPADNRPRKILIEFSFIPQLNTQGPAMGIDHVDVEAQVQSSIPKRRSKTFKMLPQQDGNLVFHPDLPDDPGGDALYDTDVLNRETGEAKHG